MLNSKLVVSWLYSFKLTLCNEADFPKKCRSAFLFPMARKKLKKKVHTNNQGLRRTSKMNAPDIARITKFTEILFAL